MKIDFYVILTDEEINKLRDGRPVYYYDENGNQTVFFSEKGFHYYFSPL